VIALTLAHKISEIIGYIGLLAVVLFFIALVVLIVHINRNPPENWK
jgi:hypothetical protein